MRTLSLRLLLAASIALTAGLPAESSSDEEIWKQRLTEIEQALREHEYTTAAFRCTDLAGDMLDRLGLGHASDRTLGLISAYRAIAAAGKGSEDEGLWYWRTAQILYPKIVDVDLDQFGPASKHLKSIPFRGRFAGTVPSVNAKIEEPKLRRHPHAEYPRGMADQDFMARYTVEFIIDVDGSVKEPAILSRNGSSTFLYALLDAFRKWTYKPARANGQPIPILHTQVLTFEIRNR